MHEDEGPPAPAYYGHPHHPQAEKAEKEKAEKQESSLKSWWATSTAVTLGGYGYHR